MILTVHDELLFEAPAAVVEDVAGLVRGENGERRPAQRAARCGCGDWGELEGSKVLTQKIEITQIAQIS